MAGLLPPAPRHTATRSELMRVAAHVLSRRRSDATGRIGLRAAPGGVATPAFGEGVEVVRLDGDAIVVERDGRATVERLTTLARAAELAGVNLDGPVELGGDAPPIGDRSAALDIDRDGALAIGDWFDFATTVLDEVVRELGDSAAPSAIQLWPEHFDVACDVGVGDAEDARANLGGSPGDGFHEDPYLYVGPWTPDRPGDDAYWNAPFGAVLAQADLLGADDRAGARARAVEFMVRGAELLRAG